MVRLNPSQILKQFEIKGDNQGIMLCAIYEQLYFLNDKLEKILKKPDTTPGLNHNLIMINSNLKKIMEKMTVI